LTDKSYFEEKGFMKQFRIILVTLFLVAILTLVLTACGPKATPGPVVLTITGSVGKTLSLTDADLHAMTVATISAQAPKQSASQSFSGVRLSDLMSAAQVKTEAVSMVMTGSDGYTATLDIPTVKACTDCMISFGDTAGTLNAVMPGQTGKAWVKGIVKIEFK
jgi:hypothetical protein